MTNAPYIGVTGITTREQVVMARAAFGRHPTHKLMVGILADYKSMRNLPVESFWIPRTPDIRDISKLLLFDHDVLNMIHYTTWSTVRHEKGDGVIKEDLLRLESEAGLCLSGFQLNIPLPNPAVLAECHENFIAPQKIVLQIGDKAIAAAGGTVAGVVARLKEYEGLAHYVLFDGSCGRGRQMNPARTIEFFRACADAGLSFSPVAAGGLSASTLESMISVLKEFPNASMDAEGKLRTKRNELSSRKTTAYLKKSKLLTM